MENAVQDYLAKLPFIKNTALYKAVRRAVYLIVEHDFPLHSALNAATEVYPVKSQIDRYVRMCFAKNWFALRSRQKFLQRMVKPTRRQYIRDTIVDQQLKREYDRLVKDNSENVEIEIEFPDDKSEERVDK